MKKLLSALCLLTLANVVFAEVHTKDCWVKGPVAATEDTTAFMTLINDGNKDVTLVTVITVAANGTALYSTEQKDGQTSVVPVKDVVIPAHGRTDLKADGSYIALTGITEDLYNGDWVDLEMVFSDGQRLTKEVEVTDKMGSVFGM